MRYEYTHEISSIGQHRIIQRTQTGGVVQMSPWFASGAMASLPLPFDAGSIVATTELTGKLATRKSGGLFVVQSLEHYIASHRKQWEHAADSGAVHITAVLGADAPAVSEVG